MINAKANNVEVSAEVRGDVSEIGADTLMLIHGIYDGIAKSNKELGEFYKYCMINGIEGAFKNSDELAKHNKKLDTFTGEIVPKDSKDFMDSLEKILFNDKPHKKTNEEIIREVLEGGIDENV